MVEENNNAEKEKANNEPGSEEDTSSDSERTQLSSNEESPQGHVTLGKTMLNTPERLQASRAKIAEINKEMVEEEALPKKEVKKSARREARTKSGRGAKEPPKKLMATEHVAPAKKFFVIVPEDDSEESLTDLEPLRQRRSKMKHDPVLQPQNPPFQINAKETSDEAESKNSSPHGKKDQVFANTLLITSFDLHLVTNPYHSFIYFD